MKKEQVLTKLQELGFTTEEMGAYGYAFKYEGLTALYMPDDDDDTFLRFTLPSIFDVTDENKAFVLDVANDTNLTIKYSKTCVYSSDVWIFYECRVFDEDSLEAIIEHVMLVLKATYYLFNRKLDGDNTFPDEDEE